MLAAAFALLTAGQACAEVQSVAPPEVRKKVDLFFSEFRDGKSSEATNGLLSGRLYQDKKQELQNVVLALDVLTKNYGKIVGWELVAELKKSDYYYNQIYMLRMQENVIFFKLSFYRPTSSVPWEVSKINWNDSDDDLTLR